MIIALYERPEVETPIISAPALYSTVLKTKSLANPGVLELAPKVVPASTLSDLAVSQMTRVSIIPAVAGWFGIMPEAGGVSAQISEAKPEFQVAAGIQLVLQTRLGFWTQL